MTDDEVSEHVKTVYAHFGLAIYLSQVLEHGLVNALFVMDLVPRAGAVATRDTWPRKSDAFFDEQFRKTLGRMIESLRTVAKVPTTLEGLLAKALDRRNWLAHDYFRERAEDFMSARGRNRMIEELEEAQALFRTADEELDKVAKPLREKYGYTEEKLNALYEEMKRNSSSHDL